MVDRCLHVSFNHLQEIVDSTVSVGYEFILDILLTSFVVLDVSYANFYRGPLLDWIKANMSLLVYSGCFLIASNLTCEITLITVGS